jgi:hypothetical protein
MCLLQIRKEVEPAIRLEKLEALKPHEKTDPKAVEQLAYEIETEDMQKDPIIVERDSNIVLDGMHRLAALKKLSCTSALCYLVPYKHVRVDRWYRLFISNQTIPTIFMIESMQRLDKFNIEYIDDPQDAVEFINENKAVGALITKEKSILIESREAVKELVDVYNHLEFIEILFKFHFGIRIKFASRLEMDGKDVIGVLIPPKLSCKDVKIAAKSKVLFPLKSTRHIPKIRPLSVNLPISFLRDEDIQKKNKELKTFLHRKEIQLFPGGLEINGRTYEAAVLKYK